MIGFGMIFPLSSIPIATISPCKVEGMDFKNSKDSLMKISQYEIWLANLNPSKGTEPGKVRPVVVVQSNLLNDIHLSTIICPITTNVLPELKILRVALTKKQLDEKSEVLVDQLRAIDNKRFIKKLGKLTKEQITQLKTNLSIVLDL